MRSHFLFVLVFASACAPAGQSSSTSSASSSSGGTVMAPCGLIDAPTQLTVSEGGRLDVTLATDPADALLTVPAVDGIRVSVAEDGRSLRIKPGYGITGAHDVTVHLVCGAQQKDVAVPLMVRALRWSALPSWTGGQTGPLGREYGSMWIDAADANRLIVFGGYHYVPMQFTTSWDGWSLDLTTGTWTELMMTDPPHLPGGRILPISGTHTAWYYGGVTPDGETPYSLRMFDAAPGALAWTDVPSDPRRARGDYQPAFIFDAPRSRYLALCGVSGSLGYHCGVNAFYFAEGSMGSWLPVSTTGDMPQGRNGFFSVHDVETERFIMFAGDRGSGTWEGDIAQDLWSYELAEDRWVKLSDGDPRVVGRRNGAAMLDPVNHRMFLFGGTPDGATTAEGLWALDLDRGEEHWDRVVVDGEPPVRTSGMAVYDAERARMLVGFGNGAAVYADLWALAL